MECQYKLNEIMNFNHMILILISKYLSNKIIERNLWVNKLEQLIMKYDPNLKNALRIIKEIAYYCNILIKLIPEILNICQNAEFLAIYNQLDNLSSQKLYNIYREKIHRIINQNGSILASSSYFKNNKTNVSIPVPYLPNWSNKPYTLVLDLDETLIHFKPNPNNEESGTIKIRPYLYQFLDNVKKYYELVIFTAATQEYADPIINALENNKKYFDYRLYRIHTIIIDNDFVKDLSKLGRDLSKTLIVDNMEQNYKLQKNNGITIRPFWGKDNEDTALVDLLDILIKIAEKNLDVRTGLKLFKEDIISKVTSNIFRRSQNRY
jgi:CTD small phosphatase-like protein 2